MIEMDFFDRLPDPLVLLVFNYVSDVKTLVRCLSVSKRFYSLVPQTESLSLKVDCVISSDSGFDSLFFDFLKSILKSLHDLFNVDREGGAAQNSPAQILSRFDWIRSLEIELPSGDLQLDKGVLIKWRAEFGKTLKSCVILGFRAGNSGSDYGDAELDFAQGLKTAVVWTISSLIAASGRHYLLKDVVKEHEEMERLMLKDTEGEGTLVMEKEGLREWRRSETEARGGEGGWEWEASRTSVPSVRMRTRHEARVQLKKGVWVESATLVVVRPSCSRDRDGDGVQSGEVGGDVEDTELAMAAYGGGVYEDVVRVLLKSRSYSLEMNSF